MAVLVTTTCQVTFLQVDHMDSCQANFQWTLHLFHLVGHTLLSTQLYIFQFNSCRGSACLNFQRHCHRVENKLDSNGRNSIRITRVRFSPKFVIFIRIIVNLTGRPNFKNFIRIIETPLRRLSWVLIVLIYLNRDEDPVKGPDGGYRADSEYKNSSSHKHPT